MALTGCGIVTLINKNDSFSTQKSAADSGGHNNAMPSSAPPVFSRYVIFSVTLFLIILIAGSAAFFFSMRQIIRGGKNIELTRLLEVERIKLESSVNKEIAIILKMATSPLIQNHFENPTQAELAKNVKAEIKAYRKNLLQGASVFWMNDTDKMFYIDEQEPYPLDPHLPSNYWYLMTLNDTEKYNFNINYNPDLNVTNLWINAPVFNSEGRAIGVLGSGINLTAFVDAVYENYNDKVPLYFFNKAGEITGSKDIGLVAAKTIITNELYDHGADILALAESLHSGEVKTFTVTNGAAAVISIPALEWYAVAVYSDSIDDFNTTLTAFFFLVIMAIAFILILSNIFIARLLVPLRNAMVSLEDTTKVATSKHEEILASIRYASKIQKNILPSEKDFQKAFADYSIIWKPRDIVGGDMYWIKNFDEGTVLCVCDCTGHGTPGALLTMLVASAFEAIVRQDNCKDTGGIIWELEQRFVNVFGFEIERYNVSENTDIRDGCDLAVLFIAKNGDVTVSAGRTNVFVCNGQNVRRLRGQKISVGDGKLKSADDVKTIHIPYDSENRFYVASDGLFDQPGGGRSLPFGYKSFQGIILENHKETHSVISEKIWAAFKKYRGTEPSVDDFELITFRPQRGTV